MNRTRRIAPPRDADQLSGTGAALAAGATKMTLSPLRAASGRLDATTHCDYKVGHQGSVGTQWLCNYLRSGVSFCEGCLPFRITRTLELIVKERLACFV